MRRLRAFLLRMAGIFPSEHRDREIAAELESHIAMQTEDNLRAGMSPGEARRQAYLKLGGMERAGQAYRDRSTLPLLENLMQDVRYALRQLVKNPGFAITAILVLALGIGSSVTIFAFVDAALIQPLPYHDPTRLVAVYEATNLCPRCNVSYSNFLDWKKSSNPFESLDAWGYSTFLLRTTSGAQSTPGVRVSDGFFRTLGVAPILGRDFHPGEDAAGAPRTVLISYAAWQNRYGGSRNVLGKPIVLDDDSYTIIGVLPRDFHFALRGAAEFWTPLGALSSCEQRRSCHSLFGIARLKDGVSVAAALAGMQAIAQQMRLEYPDVQRGYGADVVPLSDAITGNVRPVLLLLFGGSALLLLIACVNVSSLLLVRSESRKREIAVRGALGASPARLVRQFVTEGLVLVAVGCSLGLASAYLAMQLLLRLIPADMMVGMPYLQALGLGPRVLTFAALLALGSAILFSLSPALHMVRANLHNDLAEGGRSAAGVLWRRLGSKLVVVELATAVVLLTTAGLLGKSLYQLLHVATGVRSDHVATIQVNLPPSYSEDKQVLAVERRIIDRMRALPGVKSAGITTSLPLSSWSLNTNIRVIGKPWNGEHQEAGMRNVSSAYLQAVGATLVAGRYFTEAEDDATKPGVALVNQAFAWKYFPSENPIGRRIAYESAHDSMQVIGLIEDVKEGQLDTDNRPAIYVPFVQGWFSSFGIVVRTSQAEQSILPSLSAALRQIDPDIATGEAATMTDLMNNSRSAYLHRSSTWLVGSFAALALLLGIVGLYGVVAYSVSQRTREIGVRMALGARRSSVYQLVMTEAAWLAVTGAAIGLVCSIGAAMLMRNLLFGTQAWDVPTLVAVAAVLTLSALLASYIPARRAASVNPVEALRAE